MSELSQSVEHLIIPNEKVPVSAYQAIYHKLTSKVERTSEIFEDAYEIRADDIIQLDHLLHQTIKQYPVQSSNSTCSISLYKFEKLSISSIDKFTKTNFTTKKPTEAIVYEFDFFTVLPVEIKEAENIVQRFKVSIIIDQDFVEHGENGVPYYISGMQTGRNIECMIEYSDFSVGRNLQVTVQDWVSNLTTKRKSWIITFLERRGDFLNAYIGFIFSAAALFGYAGWTHNQHQTAGGERILLAMGIATLMYVVGRSLVVFFYRQVTQIKPLTFICITAGDRERFSRLSRSKSIRSWTAGFFGITIIAGLLVNIFASLILDWMRS